MVTKNKIMCNKNKRSYDMRKFDDPFDILSSARKQLSDVRKKLIERAYEEEPNYVIKYSISHALELSDSEIRELYDFLNFLSTKTDEEIINHLFKENNGKKL
jgi:hypothetical protein